MMTVRAAMAGWVNVTLFDEFGGQAHECSRLAGRVFPAFGDWYWVYGDPAGFREGETLDVGRVPDPPYPLYRLVTGVTLVRTPAGWVDPVTPDGPFPVAIPAADGRPAGPTGGPLAGGYVPDPESPAGRGGPRCGGVACWRCSAGWRAR
jgi:hypothetical protein